MVLGILLLVSLSSGAFAADCSQPQPDCNHCVTPPHGDPVCADCVAHNEWWTQCKVINPLIQSAQAKLNSYTQGLDDGLKDYNRSFSNVPDRVQIKNDIDTLKQHAEKAVEDAWWTVCGCIGQKGYLDYLNIFKNMKDHQSVVSGIDPQAEALAWFSSMHPKFQPVLDQGVQTIENAHQAFASVINGLTDLDRLRRYARGEFNNDDLSQINQASANGQSALLGVATSIKNSVPSAEETIHQALNVIGQTVCTNPSHENVIEAVCIVGPLFIQVAPHAALAEAQLKEQRHEHVLPPTIDTGYDPATALSSNGSKILRQRAEKYEEWMNLFHVIDNKVVGCVETNLPDFIPSVPVITPPLETQLKRVRGCQKSKRLTNSGYDLGQYLIALANKYSVTHASADLNSLTQMLKGYFDMMTVAGAPNHGKIFRFINGVVDTSQQVRPQPGLPVRYFTDINSDMAKDPDFKSSDTSPGHGIFEFDGTLDSGATGKFVFEERQSGDDDYPLVSGALAAFDVLANTHQRPDLQLKIAHTVANFGLYYLRSGLKINAMNGSSLGKSINPFEPLSFLGQLAFLKAAYYVADQAGLTEAVLPGISELRTTYHKLVDSYFGQDFKQWLNQASIDLEHLNMSPEAWNAIVVSRLIVAFEDVYWLFAPRWQLGHYVPAMDLLIKYELDPETSAAYRAIARSIVIPLAQSARDPLIDSMIIDMLGPDQLTANNEKFTTRLAGVLYQYRDCPAPFCSRNRPPRSAPTELSYYYADYRDRSDIRNPVFDTAKDFWENTVHVNAPRFWATLAPDMQNKFGSGPFSIWPLGPSAVPMALPELDPTWMIGGSPLNHEFVWGLPWDSASPQKTVELFSQNNFLAAYWLARKNGALPSPATED